ncbi:MAG TPA: hypothetical protein VHI32_03120 [Burkholderiales bacterium]|jgi:hypothetical protein|nr:hypothetical protein [Burkholderiales bacterium]
MRDPWKEFHEQQLNKLMSALHRRDKLTYMHTLAVLDLDFQRFMQRVLRPLRELRH